MRGTEKWKDDTRKWSVLRYILLLILLCSGLFIWQASLHTATVYATSHRHSLPLATSDTENASAVIVLDNVSQIRQYDSKNDRYAAATLFAQLASEGDRIGTVEITSQQTVDKTKGYFLPHNMTNDNKKQLTGILTAEQYDPGPTAYFSPALREAGNMLQGEHTTNKYVVLVTDTLAASGDNTPCNDPFAQANPNHNWYCVAGELENHGITVIVIAFSSGNTQEFDSTSQYIFKHGGSAHTVESGATLLQELSKEYTSIFSSIHSNVFIAQLDLAHGNQSVTLSDKIDLESVTFLALGNSKVSLSSVKTPDNSEIAGVNGDNLYHNEGSIYWLETVSKAPLNGTWNISSKDANQSQVFIVATSRAHFNLLDPKPSQKNSEISVRYIPGSGSIILQAEVTEGNAPLQGIPFTLVSSCCSVFGTDNTPNINKNDPAVQVLTFTVPPSSTVLQPLPLSIGLGNAIGKNAQGQNIYLAKSFTLEPRNELQPASISVPASPSPAHPLSAQNATIPITTQPVSNSNSQTTATLFSNEKGGAWKLQTTGFSTLFPLLDGCGAVYGFAAVEQISGQLDGHPYEYLTYAQQNFTSYLQPSLTWSPKFVGNSTLAWWSWQKWLDSIQGGNDNLWRITFTSNACQGHILQTKLDLSMLHSSFGQPSIRLEPGANYTLDQSGNHIVATVNVPSGQTAITLAANIAPCGWTLARQTAILHLKTLPVPVQDISLSAATEAEVACPAPLEGVANGVKQHPVSSITGFCLILISGIQLCSYWSWKRRKQYLTGSVRFAANTIDAAEDLALAPVDDIKTDVRIPEGEKRDEWYLTYSKPTSTSTGIYTIESWAPHIPVPVSVPVLKFSIGPDDGGSPKPVFEATRQANESVPRIYGESAPLQPGEKHIQEGQLIQIGHDLLELDFDIAE